MKIYDITRPIVPGMPVYPGDPEVAIRPWLSRARGDAVNVSALTLGSHTGTHVDAPRHLSDAGVSLDRLPLELLVGPARVVDLRAVRHIDGAALRRASVLADGPVRLLLRTRPLPAPPSGTPDYPALTPDAAAALLEAEVRLLGVEASSVDAPSASDLPVHRMLLGAGIVVLENLDLSAVPAGEYELICLPLKLRGADGAPVRAALLARPARTDDPAGRRR